MSNINAEVLKLAKGNVYEELQNFMSNFDLKLRMDENIILIMCAILLFSPSRPRIVHTEVIKLEQVCGLKSTIQNIHLKMLSFITELLLLPLETIFRKHLPGMWSEVHFHQAVTENWRGGKVKLVYHWRIFECEPDPGRTAPQRNLWFKKSLNSFFMPAWMNKMNEKSS